MLTLLKDDVFNLLLYLPIYLSFYLLVYLSFLTFWLLTRVIFFLVVKASFGMEHIFGEKLIIEETHLGFFNS